MKAYITFLLSVDAMVMQNGTERGCPLITTAKGEAEGSDKQQNDGNSGSASSQSGSKVAPPSFVEWMVAQKDHQRRSTIARGNSINSTQPTGGGSIGADRGKSVQSGEKSTATVGGQDCTAKSIGSRFSVLIDEDVARGNPIDLNMETSDCYVEGEGAMRGRPMWI